MKQEIRDKIKKYFENSGVKKMWFAQQIGMDRTTFYHMLLGKRIIAPRFWNKIIEVSNNFITLEDLLSDLISDTEGIYIESLENPYTCKVSLQALNKTY